MDNMKNLKTFEDFNHLDEKSNSHFTINYCPVCGSKSMKSVINAKNGKIYIEESGNSVEAICKDFHCSSCGENIMIEVDEDFKLRK